MYMFTQCSRQLGSFPPTLMFQAQIKGKCSPVPYRAHIPFTQSCSCRRRGFLPPLHLGVEGTLHKLDHRVISTMLALSHPNPPWLEWQLGRCQALDLSVSIDVHERLGRRGGLALLSLPALETRRQEALPQRRDRRAVSVPTGWHRDPAKEGQVAGRRLGTITEWMLVGFGNAGGVGAGGTDSRSWWLGHVAPKPGQWCSVADWGHGRITGSKLRGKVQKTAPKLWSNVK